MDVLRGVTRHDVTAAPGPDSSYEVRTPDMNYIVQQSNFVLAVEDGPSSLAVAKTGTLFAVGGGVVTEITPGTGMRTEDGVKSAVLPVNDINQLDVVLDGAPATVTTEGDVRLNVRMGPSMSQDVMGSILPAEVDRVFGRSGSNEWYRVAFEDRHGWISAANLVVDVEVGNPLVTFEPTYVEVPPDASNIAASDAPLRDNLAGSTASAEADGGQLQALASYSSEEVNLLAAMNEWRQSQGLLPFHINATLTDMARGQANFLANFPQIPGDVHIDANGRYPRERASVDFEWPTYAIPERIAIGENVYVGNSISTAVTWWQNSDIHNRTATNPAYREIGIAAVPHPWGYIYVTVFGARPNEFAPQVNLSEGVVYIPTEQYNYKDGGDWIQNVEDFQILPDVLSELDDNAWIPYSATIELPSDEPFVLALREGDKLLFLEVNPINDIAVLPDVVETSEED